MELKYQISEADFMSAYEVLWRSRKLGTLNSLAWGAIGVLGGVVCLMLGAWVGHVLWAVGALLILIVLLRSFLHRRAYRENPKFTGPITAVFEDTEIRVESAVGESRLEWSVFSEATEADEVFLLMMSKNVFSIIPKRTFDGEAAEIDAFRALLSTKLGAVRRFN